MGKVNHFEIPYDDRTRAVNFYASVFGWEIRDSGMPGVEYDMAYTAPFDDEFMPEEKGVINGGMMPRTMPGEGPVIVVTVDNLEDAIIKAKANGGEVVAPPSRVGDMGLYARLKDSEGNVIGVWESLNKA